MHSPFAERTDAGEVIDRNDCSLVMQAWFQIEGREVRLMLSSDTTHELVGCDHPDNSLSQK